MEDAVRRQEQILQVIRARRRTTIKHLAETFDVSTATIRRDLKRIIPENNIVQTVNGGVEYREQLFDTPASEVMGEHVQEKIRIAEYVAGTVKDYDDLLIGPGSTTLFVGRILSGIAGVRFRIVTNQIELALETMDLENIETILLGGRLTRNHSIGYQQHKDYLDDCNPSHRLIFSADGIHPEHGLTLFETEFAPILRKMIAASQEVILVADGTKLGRVYFTTLCQLSIVDTLVTDDTAPTEIVEALRTQGVRVEVV